MPQGLQLVGPFADAALLGVAESFQVITDWHRVRPGPTTQPGEAGPATTGSAGGHR